MSCRLEEAIKDIEALASKPGAKSIAKELAQIANEAKESLNIQPTAEYQRKGEYYLQNSVNTAPTTSNRVADMVSSYKSVLKDNSKLTKLLTAFNKKLDTTRGPVNLSSSFEVVTANTITEKELRSMLNIIEKTINKGGFVLEPGALESKYSKTKDGPPTIELEAYENQIEEIVVLYHEMIHMFTSNYLTSADTATIDKVLKPINELYTKIINEDVKVSDMFMSRINYMTTRTDNMNNLAEVLAITAAEPDFRKELIKLLGDTVDRSLLQKVLITIKKILGLSTETDSKFVNELLQIVNKEQARWFDIKTDTIVDKENSANEYRVTMKKGTFNKNISTKEIILQQKGVKIDFDKALDNKLTKIPKKIYHGFSGNVKSYINKDGDLVMKPSKNFRGKTESVSFTHSLDTAYRYATMVKGEGPLGFNFIDSKIFEINTVGLKTKLSRESEEEWAINTSNEVIIPKEYFKIIEHPLTNRMREIDDEYSFEDFVRDTKEEDPYDGYGGEDSYGTYVEKYLDEVVHEINPDLAEDVYTEMERLIKGGYKDLLYPLEDPQSKEDTMSIQQIKELAIEVAKECK